MFKPIHFHGPDDSFWFTSDTHFNHKPFVFKPRGYASSQEHDDGLIHNWNAVVKNTDTVFFLGDFILSVNKAEDALKYLRRLNFNEIYMLWGNHNASLKQIYQEEVKSENLEIYPTVKFIDGIKKIIFVGHYYEVYINGQHIIMDHFAYRTWNHNGKGTWCICGHSHGNDSGINELCKEGKILDVGVDKFGRPINFRELKNIMNSKNIHTHDHHDKDGNEYIDRTIYPSEKE